MGAIEELIEKANRNHNSKERAAAFTYLGQTYYLLSEEQFKLIGNLE